jgi:hypothetical protein
MQLSSTLCKPDQFACCIRRIITLVVAGVFLLTGCSKDTALCDQVMGLRKYEEGYKVAAYEHLRHCETRDDITGETLHTLAKLVDSGEFGEYASEEIRNFKVSGLYLLAALKGHRHAIHWYSEIYRLRYERDRDFKDALLADCLASAGKLENGKRRPEVNRCLKDEAYK